MESHSGCFFCGAGADLLQLAPGRKREGGRERKTTAWWRPRFVSADNPRKEAVGVGGRGERTGPAEGDGNEREEGGGVRRGKPIPLRASGT